MKYIKRIDNIGKAYTYLDIETLPAPKADFDINDFLSFRTDAYPVLKRTATEAQYNAVFAPVNSFLDSIFNNKEKTEYLNMMLIMHITIMKNLKYDGKIDGAIAIQTEEYLSDLLVKFDDSVNLWPRLIGYVQKYVPIVATENAGERPIDSPDMTFYYDEVVMMLARVMLSKLMTPIFSVFIECMKKRMDNNYKEIHAEAILKGIEAKRMADIDKKFIRYVTKTVSNVLNIQPGSIYHGFTLENVVQYVIATLKVRRFVTVDIMEPLSNIMKYIVSCIRSSAKTSISTSNKVSIGEIILPNDTGSGSGGDDGNASNLEVETMPSSKLSDFEVLIELAAEKFIDSFAAKMEIEPEVLESAYAYHYTSHCTLNNFTAYLLATAFSEELCGGQSVHSIPIHLLCKLLPLFQIHLHQQGYDDLVHMITARETGIPKIIMSGADSQLRTSWNTSVEYKECSSKFNIYVGELTWDTRLKETVDDITSTNYTYNTSPAIFDLMNENVKNGSNMDTRPGMARATCEFILQQYA